MQKNIKIELPPEIAFDDIAFEKFIKNSYKITASDSLIIQKVRRTIDARSRNIKVLLELNLFINEPPVSAISYKIPQKDVSKSKQIIIVGFGPAGMFAALKAIEMGIKPVVIERGKNVKDRRRDLAQINKEHIVNTESNYCFGEGGAGTYSDGKLYTRSHKRGNIQRILEILYVHGAPADILIDSHPHIGTNKLPKLIENIRQTILNNGGEIYFNTKVVDFIIQKNEITGIQTADNKLFEGIGVVLATGHSARDIFYLLAKKKIKIETKPFALGVRAEHHQSLIDSIQYHKKNRGEYLPPSSYSLVQQTSYDGVAKGVFSFCMCPGGIIAPCATENGEIVVNGWSPSKRNNIFANSGIVVAVDESDWADYTNHAALAALEFQKNIEQNACYLAGNTQKAPAQRLNDFIKNRKSSTLNDCSYQPGLTSIMMSEVLPKSIEHRLREGFKAFGQKMKGFDSNEAQIVGVESRTSSPVRIPRNKETYEHIDLKRLFPSGEGAGYAGGIVSAAIDGERCAERLILMYAKL